MRTPVDDLHVILEELEPSDHASGYATEDIFRDAVAFQLVY